LAWVNRESPGRSMLRPYKSVFVSLWHHEAHEEREVFPTFILILAG